VNRLTQLLRQLLVAGVALVALWSAGATPATATTLTSSVVTVQTQAAPPSSNTEKPHESETVDTVGRTLFIAGGVLVGLFILSAVVFIAKRRSTPSEDDEPTNTENDGPTV
jgi:NADH:ubiquinone oxidoreductase subunit 5 (subunit L)/multisubunit Na+/H+ antiporter MnhA subunit